MTGRDIDIRLDDGAVHITDGSTDCHLTRTLTDERQLTGIRLVSFCERLAVAELRIINDELVLQTIPESFCATLSTIGGRASLLISCPEGPLSISIMRESFEGETSNELLAMRDASPAQLNRIAERAERELARRAQARKVQS